MRTIRLGEILEVQNGFAFDSDLFSENEGIPLIRIRDLKDGILTETKYKGSFDPSFIVKKGDYLIGMDGEFRCYEWKGEDALLNQRVCRLKGFDKSIYPQYLFYGINTHLAKIERNTSFVTVKHISSKQIKEIRFLFPSLEDQIYISNILSKAETLIAQRKESLRLLDEFLKSTFLEMFGDPILNPKKFSKALLSKYFVIEPQNGLYKPSTEYGRGIRILRIDSFYNGEVIGLDKLKRLNISKDELTKYGLRKNEIVINRVNSRDYLGKAGLIPELNEPTVFESNMMRFSIDSTKLNPVYLVKLLSSKYIKQQILRCAKDAVNQSSINQQDVKGFELLVPPIKLQNQFAHIVEKTEALKVYYQISLQELENLYGSLSQRAFRGELKVKGEELSMAADDFASYNRKNG